MSSAPRIARAGPLPARSHRRARAAAPAFSLIEVMLAVLVLALGLLGLGAVIPVIIKDQQLSTAAVRAVTAANDCEASLRNRPDLNRATAQVWVGDPYFRHVHIHAGWGAWLRNHRLADPNNPRATDFEWQVPDDDELDPDTGEHVIYYDDPQFQAPWSEVSLPVSARLWPAGEAEVTEPLFVYDFVTRRLPSDPFAPPRVQVALFLRRIDPNIRPGTATLRELLTGVLGGPSRPMPVGVTGNTPATRRPTLNGTGEYAKPFRLDAEYDPRFADRLVVRGSDMERRLASQFGQRLVDNLGNVHVVARVDDTFTGGGDAVRLLLEQRVPAWLKATSAFRPAEPRDTALRHVLLTPQVPSAVRVFTIDVTDPAESWTGSGPGNQGGSP